MKHVRDGFGVPSHVASLGILGQECPSLTCGHPHVGNHHSASHLVPQAQMGGRHAIAIHLRHKDGVVLENRRQKFRPLVTDPEGVASCHPIGWSRCKDKSSIFLRHVMDGTVRTDNFRDMRFDRIQPFGTKGIILCRWMALRNLANEFVRVFIPAIISIPLVQGHLRKVVYERTLHEHIWVDQDYDVVVPFWHGNLCIVVTPYVSESMFHPVFKTKGFVPILGLLVANSLRCELFSVFGREMEQKLGVHDRELFLVEFSHCYFVLGTAPRNNPCYVALLFVKHRVEEKQIGLPIVGQGTRRGKYDVDLVGFVVFVFVFVFEPVAVAVAVTVVYSSWGSTRNDPAVVAD
mmetsp:Transcript_23874/g.52247  ORF Transcript_23874/g.52247 Transcript_23874/m.52247 type:complete len:348 (+) Transcript_23874:482-1525(+)